MWLKLLENLLENQYKQSSLYPKKQKMRFLTWLKPTWYSLHIGNYFGSIQYMLKLAKENPDSDFFLFLANMHGFTQVHDPEAMKANSYTILKTYLACGADPKRFLMYNPAEIPWHAQLNWVLSCITHMWFMERMHSYKEAVDKWNSKEIMVWTFCYPILMAADILLYDTDFVPCWKDQKQHVEFARDIAEKFNNKFGETFTVPQPLIDPNVWLILWLDGQKMSKSYNNTIWLLDDAETILKKVKKIPTGSQTVEESKNPDECNIYNLCKLFLTDEEDKALRARYLAGWLSYKESKDYLYQKIMSFLAPIQKTYNQISDQEISDMLAKSKDIVSEISEKKIKEVYEKIWFLL